MEKDKEFRIYLGEQIRQMRVNKNMSLAELAEKMQMSEKSMQRIEDGKYSIRIDVLGAIVDALDAEIAIH